VPEEYLAKHSRFAETCRTLDRVHGLAYFGRVGNPKPAHGFGFHSIRKTVLQLID